MIQGPLVMGSIRWKEPSIIAVETLKTWCRWLEVTTIYPGPAMYLLRHSIHYQKMTGKVFNKINPVIPVAYHHRMSSVWYSSTQQMCSRPGEVVIYRGLQGHMSAPGKHLYGHINIPLPPHHFNSCVNNFPQHTYFFS